MKFLVLFLFVSTTAFGMNRERAIYDLQYVPEKRVVFGITDLTYENYLQMNSGNTSKYDALQLSQTIGYAFTDNFLMSLGANYLNRRAGFESGESSSHSTTRGVSDPTISLKYRLQDNYFRFDVLSGLLVKTGDTEFDDSVSNNKAGGNQLNFGLNFGQKWELVQWSLLVKFHHQFETTSVDKFSNGTSDTSTYDAYNYYSGELSGMAFLDDRIILRGFLSAFGTDPLGAPTRSTIALVTFGPELQYLLTENFLLKTGVAYKTYQVTSQDGYNSGYVYSVGANYQF